MSVESGPMAEGFSISELCAQLGVTPSAIRKYEQVMGLPVRRYENSYRYFYLNDLQCLLHIRALESLGYSLKEAGALSIEADYHQKVEESRRHIEASKEEIRIRQLRLEYEIESQERLEQLEDWDGRFYKTVRPAIWWMTCTKDFLLINPKAIRPWAQCVPFAEPGVRVHDDVLETGFCVPDRWAEILTEEMRCQAEYYPPVPCIQSIIHVNKDSDEGELDVDLDSYFDSHNLEHEGDDIAVLLASSLRTPWRPGQVYDYYINWSGYKEK